MVGLCACGDLPHVADAGDRGHGVPRVDLPTVAAQLLGEILQQPVSINIMGVGVIARKSDPFRSENRDKTQCVVGGDLFNAHMRKIAIKRLFLMTIRDDHQSARGQVAAVAQIADGGLVQRLHGRGTVVLFDQRGRPARGVIAKRFFPFDHRDLGVTGQARRRRNACDATADDKDIGCVLFHMRPLSVAMVSAWGCLSSPKQFAYG